MTLRGALVGLVAGLFAAPAVPAEVADPASISFDGIDVVIMGEIHDNPGHHANQADWVARLAPEVLVFEMLTEAQAATVERLGGTDPDALAGALNWAETGWPDFSFYHAILAAAPEARVLGAGVARADLRRATEEGAAAVMGESAVAFGLTTALSPADRAARAQEQAEAHCNALPVALLPGMVEAQRLRDARLAQAVLAALVVIGSPVAVITGNGHARTDRGVPSMLSPLLPKVRILSIGQVEASSDETLPFDLVTLSPAPLRGDPCDAFR